MPRTSAAHSLASTIGARVKWGNTPDRTEATEPARRASPGQDAYWLTKLDAERFANASDAQKLAAAKSLKKAHFARLALKSAQARKKAS